MHVCVLAFLYVVYVIYTFVPFAAVSSIGKKTIQAACLPIRLPF
jgi:hypothetical protein